MVVATVIVLALRVSGWGGDAGDLLFGSGSEASPTNTPLPTSTLAKPSLTKDEAIGLVRQRSTRFFSASRERTWGDSDFDACGLNYFGADWYTIVQTALQTGNFPKKLPRSEWNALFDTTGRWRVELSCEMKDGSMVTVAAWTLNDKTLRIIPVKGFAD